MAFKVIPAFTNAGKKWIECDNAILYFSKEENNKENNWFRWSRKFGEEEEQLMEVAFRYNAFPQSNNNSIFFWSKLWAFEYVEYESW